MGGILQSFILGGSALRSNPLTFYTVYIQLWQKQYSFQTPSIDKWYPFHNDIPLHPFKLLLAISKLRRELGRVSNLNSSINWHNHIKGHVEIGYLTKFGALKLNKNQVITLETWLKIHTNVYLWKRPSKPYKLFKIFQFFFLTVKFVMHLLLGRNWFENHRVCLFLGISRKSWNFKGLYGFGTLEHQTCSKNQS